MGEEDRRATRRDHRPFPARCNGAGTRIRGTHTSARIPAATTTGPRGGVEEPRHASSVATVTTRPLAGRSAARWAAHPAKNSHATVSVRYIGSTRRAEG